MAWNELSRFSLLLLVAVIAGEARAQLYFRVDAGYSSSVRANFSDNSSNGFLICGDAACTSPGSFKDYGHAPVLEAGMGYAFSPAIRTDLVFGRRKYDLRTSDEGNPGSTFSADITSEDLMANGYYDFSMSGWKPYLGIGLGAARNKMSNLSLISLSVPASVDGGTRSNFAWAFMAGAGIPAWGKTTLDIGYRYINLWKVEIPPGPVTINGVVIPFPQYGGANGRVIANELTLGVRF